MRTQANKVRMSKQEDRESYVFHGIMEYHNVSLLRYSVQHMIGTPVREYPFMDIVIYNTYNVSVIYKAC